MTTAAPPVCYRFARFELQPGERRLLAAGAPVEVGPRAFDLLLALVERSGHLVTREELLERVWPGLVVEDSNLNVHVWALRKILGPDAIATVPAYGYRFMLEVETSGAESPTSAVTSRHNFPRQLTSFVGREKEIAEIKTLLAGTRLLTITGAGGCGKTRLALQVAEELLDSCPDGGWLVELASTTDPSLAPQAVASIIGLKEQPRDNFTQSVTEYLASRQLLLLLDNAEHLLAACGQLADAVLRQCPQIILLVTSRERLGLAGESTYRVPSMSLPDPEQDATVAGLTRYDSVRLFIERARLNSPHFALTDENAPTLALVCHRLDGIPLAIELAAARVRSMSLEMVSQRLDQRFRLLTGGSPMAPRRQQTLRALIDWSYDLLSDAEKAMLCRASIFAGGWTPEAAEQVCVGESIEDWEVLDLLTSLADKSLLLAEARAGETRYGLLETVRQYARERLRESGEEGLLENRHLAYFLAFAEEAEPHLVEADQQAWLDRLESERDNLRAAWACAAATGGDAARGLRLAGALWRFWNARGYVSEDRIRLSAMIAATSGCETATVRAKALFVAGNLAWGQGDLAAARTLLEASLAQWRALEDRRGIADSLTGLGRTVMEQGDYPLARALHEEALTIRRELGDRRGIANSLRNLGLIAENRGEYLVAKAFHDESLAVFRERRDWAGIGMALTNLGRVAQELGDLATGQALAEESLAIWRRLGDRQGIGWSLSDLGTLAFARHDYASATMQYEESLASRREQYDRHGMAVSLEGLAYVASAMAKPCRAARIWGMAERLREEIGCPLPAHHRPRHDCRVAAARAALSDDIAFDLAWQEGRVMTLDQMVGYAMESEVG